jgi:thymidylate kinase
LIILEGADLVGKTTLQKRILDELHRRNQLYIGLHQTAPPPNWSLRQYLPFLFAEGVVWDRFHIGQLVYRSADLLPANLDNADWDELQDNLARCRAYTVVITVEPDVIERRWRPGEMFDLVQVLAANERYKEITSTGYVTCRKNNYYVEFQKAVVGPYSPTLMAKIIVDDYLNARGR